MCVCSSKESRDLDIGVERGDGGDEGGDVLMVVVVAVVGGWAGGE